MAKFSGTHLVAQTDGAIIIDRDSESFEYLFQYLENNQHVPDSKNYRRKLQSDIGGLILSSLTQKLSKISIN